VAAIDVGEGPRSIAIGAGSVWVANETDRTLTQIDPETNAVQRTVDLAPVGHPTLFAAGEEAVWIAEAWTGAEAVKFWRYDPTSGRLAVMPTEPLGIWILRTGSGSVWAGDAPSGDLVRIDPTSGVPTARIDLVSETPFAGTPASPDDALWLVGLDATHLVRIDPATNGLRHVDLSSPLQDSAQVVAGEEGLWVTRPVDDSVERLDPETGRRLEAVRVGRDPTDIAVGGGFVWVASGRDGTVARVDPETLDTTDIEVGRTIRSMAFGEGSLWVTVDVR
jgi:streptogramin lyase